MEQNFSEFDPRKQPMHIKVFLIVFLAIFLLRGFTKGLDIDNPTKMYIALPLYFLAGVLFDLIFLTVHALFAQPVNQGQYRRMSKIYEMQGICNELTEQLRNIIPEPANRDKVLRYYLLIRLGKYEDAKEQYADIPISTLHIREYAMLITARLRQYMMNGNWGKAADLLADEEQTLESVYGTKPDYSEAFCPYEDDALDYYLLSAAFRSIAGQPEQAYAQRQKAEERAMYRPEPEALFFNSLMELHQLYAAGAFHAADAKASELIKEAALLWSPVTPGAKNDLQRDIRQAKQFIKLYTAANAVGRELSPETAVFRQKNEVKHIETP